MTNPAVLLFQLIVFIFSVMIHEVSHGVVAEKLGDPTARLQGRLTLNPISHIDPFGSILLPIILYYATDRSMVFGWAKPVPYNPNNLKNPASGAGKIAAAGPISNLVIAAFFGILLRIMGVSLGALPLFFRLIVYINVLLAIFNLVPIPPLDGSKVLFAFLSKTGRGLGIIHFLERYGTFLLILFIFFGFQLIVPLIQLIFTFLTGQSAGF